MLRRKSKEELNKRELTRTTGRAIERSLSKDIKKLEDALRIKRGGMSNLNKK